MDFHGDLAELVTVGAGVVPAEQELSTWENKAYVCLCTATVTAVGRSKDWSVGSGSGTCHAYLQRIVARDPSGQSLACINPHYACSIGVQPPFGTRERSQTPNVFVTKQPRYDRRAPKTMSSQAGTALRRRPALLDGRGR